MSLKIVHILFCLILKLSSETNYLLFQHVYIVYHRYYDFNDYHLNFIKTRF